MGVVGILVEIHAALGAQATAILAAQRLQRQLIHQRIAQQRFKIGEGAVVEQWIRVFGFFLAGDDVDLVLLPDRKSVV